MGDANIPFIRKPPSQMIRFGCGFVMGTHGQLQADTPALDGAKYALFSTEI
jgi:hypothetical protein